MAYTFAKSDRLRKRREFLEIQKKGKKIANAYFIVLVKPGATFRTRLGITASKKVGNATVRNRLKRLSREYFRKNRSTFKSHWDINLIIKPRAAELSSKHVFLALKEIFERIPNSFEA